MSNLENLGDAWPFPAVTEARQAGARTWFETTEARYWHFLEVLPPIYFPGGFFVSEAADHDVDGVPIYSGFVKRGERYFVREFANAPAAVKAALADLDAALTGGAV